MTPYLHSKCTAVRFGGKPEDYIEVHRFIDSSKYHLADYRHRAILHNTFGMDICERVFGDYIVNSEGNMVPVRDIAMHHIQEDIGFVPTIQQWFEGFHPKGTWSRVALPSKILAPKLWGKDAWVTIKEIKNAIIQAGKN